MEELNSGLLRRNPDSGRVKDLNQGPPDFKSICLLDVEIEIKIEMEIQILTLMVIKIEMVKTTVALL